jgi:hypothetical protein
MTEQLADLEVIAERCVREADGDVARAYQLVEEQVEGSTNERRPPLLRRLLREKEYYKLLAPTMARIGDAHPFKGKQKRFRRISRPKHEDLKGIGIDSDGRLWNPNNYPEDKVRAALRYVAAEREVRRKEGAAKAVKTRAPRHSNLIYEVGASILAGRKYGPRSFCCICKKSLSDQVSIERGIGPECWDHILTLIEHSKDQEAAKAAADGVES